MEREITNQGNDKMTRGEFLKKTAFGAAAAAIALKFGGGTVSAFASTVQPESTTNDGSVKQYMGSTPPTDKNITWIDTTDGGVMKYWNGKEWTPIKSVWG